MRILAAILLLSLLPGAAQAQGMCGNYLEMVKTLKNSFGETSLGKGIQGEVTVIEIFAGDDTFTVIAATTNGRACIIATGKGWEPAYRRPKEQDT